MPGQACVPEVRLTVFRGSVERCADAGFGRRPRIRTVSNVDSALAALKVKIEHHEQQRARALARAEDAKAAVEEGMRVLREEYGLESVEAAEQEATRMAQEVQDQMVELENMVTELESDNE